MRTIFRVETPDGVGAFMGRQWVEPDDFHAARDRHPQPGVDGIPYYVIEARHRFGFANEDDARLWFGGVGERLSRLGYVLSTYEVPDDGVIDGGTQLIFDPQYARLVDRRSPAVLDEPNDREVVMA